MIVDTKWKAGLVVGLEADEVYLLNDDNEMEDTPRQCWYVHLGIITVCLIF